MRALASDPSAAGLLTRIRFDDRLITVLDRPDVGLSARLAKWRQVLDILGQLPAGSDDQGQAAGYDYLRKYHQDVPPETLRQLKRSLASRPIPAELLPFLAPPGISPALELADAPNDNDLPVHGDGFYQRPQPHAKIATARNRGPAISEANGATQPRIFLGGSPSPLAGRSRRSLTIVDLVDDRRDRAKAAFTTRRVPGSAMQTLISGPVRPRTGDLVLARVDRIHYQTRLELASGRKAALEVGDEIIVAYGDRYATDQFEAEVPADLRPTNLVATGGVASHVVSRSSGIRQASHIIPLGLIGNAGGTPLNLRDFALGAPSQASARPRTVAVLGTSMNSGKTTTNKYLVTGLSRAGLKTGAVKITGTGSGGDYWVMVDAGAHRVLDFTDGGYSSTYKISVEEIEAVAINLIGHLAAEGCDIILVEIADGLFQEQNSELIRSDFFKAYIDGVFFAAGEAMGAAAGVKELRSLGIPVLGVSGKLTASELLIREARRYCDAPVLTKADLSDPSLAPKLVGMRALPSNDASDPAQFLPETAGAAHCVKF